MKTQPKTKKPVKLPKNFGKMRGDNLLHKKPKVVKIKPVKAWALTLYKGPNLNRMGVDHYGRETDVYAIFYTKDEAEWWNHGNNKVIPVLITPL